MIFDIGFNSFNIRQKTYLFSKIINVLFLAATDAKAIKIYYKPDDTNLQLNITV